jgi:hypothetical protein
MQLISLGCNCHVAYWLRKSGLQTRSFPFDWLLTPPHLGVRYVVENMKNRFSLFLQELSLNNRGHCISKHYPYAELFHHRDLISDTERLRDEEQTKLLRRAERFTSVASKEGLFFIYCYELKKSSSTEQALGTFKDSIHELLSMFSTAILLIYFLENDVDFSIPVGFEGFHERLIVKKYIRHTEIDKTWGTFPDFLNDLPRQN